ncbi:hypothetical protein DVH24_003760, partial [Malus domestica]
VENVGFTKKDCQNFLYRKKSETIEEAIAHINHHWINVILNCAFLLYENTKSFVWLFKTFLELMGNKQLKTIFIDEEQAMANAIEQVFTETCHQLCIWHIAHNAIKNISSLYASPKFRTHFNKVFGGC